MIIFFPFKKAFLSTMGSERLQMEDAGYGSKIKSGKIESRFGSFQPIQDPGLPSRQFGSESDIDLLVPGRNTKSELQICA
jgi:hypothetical protein